MATLSRGGHGSPELDLECERGESAADKVDGQTKRDEWDKRVQIINMLHSGGVRRANEAVGREEAWMRNGLALTFSRQQPRGADCSIHYSDEEKSLVISVATLISRIGVFNELLTTIVLLYIHRRVSVRLKKFKKNVRYCVTKLVD